MKFGRWSWGYIPVALVLGLIWFEFWRSGAFSPPPRQEAPPETPTATTESPSPTPGADPVVETPHPNPVDETWINNLPPISVSFSNVSLDSALDSLREALGPKALLQTINSGGQNRNYSLDMKNAPFWEVFGALAKQGSIELQSAAHYSTDGLAISPYGSGLYQFQTSGPAILYPISITYTRQSSGQGNPREQVGPRYNLRLGTAVDPRIRIAGYSPVEVTQAQDDQGRRIAVPANQYNGTVQPTNYWDTTLSFTAPEPRAEKATFQCQLRFVAQLTETTVTVEDPTQKIGQNFTLADRTMPLTRCEFQNNQLLIAVADDIPRPQQQILFSIVGANGRALGVQLQSGNSRSVSLNNMSGPYKLVFRAPDQVREMSLPFELKDIPLP